MSDAVVPTRRVLLFGNAALGLALRAPLAACAVEIDVADWTDDSSAGLSDFVRERFKSSAEPLDLVVCDCGDEGGLRRGFFVSRDAGDRRVALLVLGESAESGPVATLVAGIRKARPTSRVAIITDRVGEDVRLSGSAGRAAWTPESLATALIDLIEARDWHPGAVVRLKDASAGA